MISLYGPLETAGVKMIRAMLHYYCGYRKSLSPQAQGNLRRFGRIVTPKELYKAWYGHLYTYRIYLEDIKYHKRRADRYWPNYLKGSDYLEGSEYL